MSSDTLSRSADQVGPPAPHKRGKKSVVIIAVVVAVLAVAAAVALFVSRGSHEASSASSSGSGSGNVGTGALQRTVPDSTHPSLDSLAGAWALDCDGVYTQMIVQLRDGSAALLRTGKPSVSLLVHAGTRLTAAEVMSPTDPAMQVGSLIGLKIVGGKLQFTVGDKLLSLYPTSESYNGSVAC